MAERIIVYLEQADKIALERRAKADGQKLSALLRVLIKRFLAQKGEGVEEA